MSYKDFYQDIKNKDYQSLYILYGAERLLIDRLVKTFVNQVLMPTEQAFNFIETSGADLSYEEAINTVTRLPIMSSRQIVKINGADFLTSSQWSDEEKAYFVETHQANSETITIIIADSIDKRKKIFKSASKIGALIEFAKLSDSDLAKWLIKEAKSNGKSMSREVAYRFVEGLSYNNKDSNLNLYGVLSILEKLCMSVKGDEIDLETVKAVVDDNIESNIFKMVDSVFNGDGNYCFRQLDALLLAGEAPIKIHFMVHRHLRLLLKVDNLQRRAYSRQSIADSLKLKPFVVNNLVKQLKYWTKEELIFLLKEAEVCDLNLKSALDARYALEAFLSTILSYAKVI